MTNWIGSPSLFGGLTRDQIKGKHACHGNQTTMFLVASELLERIEALENCARQLLSFHCEGDDPDGLPIPRHLWATEYLETVERLESLLGTDMVKEKAK